MTIETDPKLVREIAEAAFRSDVPGGAANRVEVALIAADVAGPILGKKFDAYSAAVGAEYDRLDAASGPDGQLRSVREDNGAAKRVLAYLDDHRARYPYDATGVIADLPAAYSNGLLPLHELLESDLRDLLAENARLRLQNDELLTENREMQYGPTVSAEEWEV